MMVGSERQSLKTRDGRQSVSDDRLAWIDIARGIGIILVVYGHALRGIFTDLATMPDWVRAQDEIIYAFHMPLFFCAAGLFLWASLAKGRGYVLRGKVRTVLWPYFLWSLIAGGIEVAAARYVNTPIDVADLLLVPIKPIEQFWFLYTLFVCQMIVLVAYPRRAVLIVLTIFGLSLASYGIAGGAIIRSFMWLPFVTVGVLAARPILHLACWTDARLAVALLFAVAGFAALLTVDRLEHSALDLPVSLALGLLGSLAVAALALLLRCTVIGNLMKRLGEASLAIFVMHTIASAGARIILNAIGAPLSPLAMLVATTATGLAAPYFAYRIAMLMGLGPTLGFGGARPLAR